MCHQKIHNAALSNLHHETSVYVFRPISPDSSDILHDMKLSWKCEKNSAV